MLFHEFLGLRGQMGDRRGPCEQCTRVPQELTASRSLSLGSCTEQGFCQAGSRGVGLLDNRSISEQSMEPARHRVYMWTYSAREEGSQNYGENAANGGQTSTVEGRADVRSQPLSSQQQEESKDFSSPHAVLWGWKQRQQQV